MYMLLTTNTHPAALQRIDVSTRRLGTTMIRRSLVYGYYEQIQI